MSYDRANKALHTNRRHEGGFGAYWQFAHCQSNSHGPLRDEPENDATGSARFTVLPITLAHGQFNARPLYKRF